MLGARPCLAPVDECLLARCSNPVVATRRTRYRRFDVARQEPAPFQRSQRRIQRTLVHRQCAFGLYFELFGNLVAVHGAA